MANSRPEPEPPPLLPFAVVVGRNCNRIRSENQVTQAALARHASSIGLNWSDTKVGHFEAGRIKRPPFATVLAVTLALQLALEEAAEKRGAARTPSVTLADLIGREGYIALTDSFAVPATQVEGVCRGQSFAVPVNQRYHLHKRSPGPLRPDEATAVAKRVATWMTTDAKPLMDGVANTLQRSGITEQRLRRYLRDRLEKDISPTELATATFVLWKSTFSEERDRRAGPDASQQKRGRVSLELRAELEKALDDGDG